jgi:hypothetical protein
VLNNLSTHLEITKTLFPLPSSDCLQFVKMIYLVSLLLVQFSRINENEM